MNIQAKIFEWLALFFLIMSVVYALWTGLDQGSVGDTGVEWVGTTGLVLVTLMSLMLGEYFRFVDNRIEVAEDNDDGEIAEGAGELGFFSPHSFWPFWIGVAVLIVGFGAAFWYYWLMALGAASLVAAVCGLVWEYHIGRERH